MIGRNQQSVASVFARGNHEFKFYYINNISNFQDIQVYHYYRDLIKFYSRGNPKRMLKCINPKEAELLDFAAGIHIRFRLAGVCEYSSAKF